MKHNKTILATILLLIGLSFTSCYLPSPLYGTWQDNAGGTLKFFDDGTFSGALKGSEGNTITYTGSYSVIDNIIVFLFNEPETYSINAEWDIRGAMLYLTWTDAENVTKNLSLAHTAR